MIKEIADDSIILNYERRKEEKNKIEKELLLIAWHPSRYFERCLDNDEKSIINNIVT